MKSYKVGNMLYWSKRQLLEAYDVSSYRFNKLIDSGMSVEEALEKLTKENVKKRFKDRESGKGVKKSGVAERNRYVVGDANYLNLKDVSDAYGIPVGTLQSRLDLGMTIDESVLGRYRARRVRGSDVRRLENLDYYVEYERARFISKDDFLSYYGVKKGDYVSLMENGFTSIEAMDRLRSVVRSDR